MAANKTLNSCEKNCIINFDIIMAWHFQYRYACKRNQKVQILPDFHLKIDDFGVSDAMMKYPCWGASWTLDPYNSMKTREKPENVLPGLWILLHPSTMCSYFSHSQTFRHLTNIKMCAWRWSWEKIFDFKFHGQILIIC